MQIKLLSLLLVLALVFTGCAGLPANATPQEKARAALNTAQIGIKYTVGPAITAFLLLEKDDAQRAKDAAYVYAGASALNAAATGELLTKEQLAAIIGSFTRNDPRYVALAGVLVAEYANVYPLFKISGTSPVKFLTEIAQRAQDAAKPFLAP
jgi:hypothetical protein